MSLIPERFFDILLNRKGQIKGQIKGLWGSRNQQPTDGLPEVEAGDRVHLMVGFV